jgi:hypothetical protein
MLGPRRRSFCHHQPSPGHEKRGRKAFVPSAILDALFLFSFSLLAGAAGSHLAHAAQQQPQSGRIVTTGAYVLNVGGFDVASGSFTADFYLWFSWRGDWSGSALSTSGLPERFELMNGQVNKMTLVESDRNVSGAGDNYLLYRIQASMSGPVNLQGYPFDRHNLTIEAEDQVYIANQLQYQVDNQSRIDPLVSIQGWDIQPSAAKASVSSHQYETTFGYPGENSTETYSRFVFSMPIQRPLLSSAIKTFIPIVVILLIAFVSFLVKPEDFGPRLSLNVTTILTAVAYHLTLSSSIPPVGFLTLADRLMLSVYVVLVYALVITVGLAAISDERRLQTVKKLNRISGTAAPIVAAILIGLQFIL